MTLKIVLKGEILNTKYVNTKILDAVLWYKSNKLTSLAKYGIEFGIYLQIHFMAKNCLLVQVRKVHGNIYMTKF